MKIDFTQVTSKRADELKAHLGKLGLTETDDLNYTVLTAKKDEFYAARTFSHLELDAISRAYADLRDFIRSQVEYACEVFSYNANELSSISDASLDAKYTELKTNKTLNRPDIAATYQVLKNKLEQLKKLNSNQSTDVDAEQYKRLFEVMLNNKFPVTDEKNKDLKALLLTKINTPIYLAGLVRLHNKNILQLKDIFSNKYELLGNNSPYLFNDDVWNELITPTALTDFVEIFLERIATYYDRKLFTDHFDKEVGAQLAKQEKDAVIQNLMRLNRKTSFFYSDDENDDATMPKLTLLLGSDVLVNAEHPLFWEIFADEAITQFMINHQRIRHGNKNDTLFKELLLAFDFESKENKNLNAFFFHIIKETNPYDLTPYREKIPANKALFEKIYALYVKNPTPDRFARLFDSSYCCFQMAMDFVDKNELTDSIDQALLETIEEFANQSTVLIYDLFVESIENKIERKFNAELLNKTTPHTATSSNAPASAIAAPNKTEQPTTTANTASATTSTPAPTANTVTPAAPTFWQRHKRALIGLGIGLGIAAGLLLLGAATIFTLGAIHVITASALFTLLTTVAVPTALKLLTLPAVSATTAEAIVIGTGAGSTATIATGLGATGSAIGHHQDKKAAKQAEEAAKRAAAAARPAPSGDSSAQSSQTYPPPGP
jgi:hypothetical protein